MHLLEGGIRKASNPIGKNTIATIQTKQP